MIFKKINIGDRWIFALKSSSTDKELFAVYKSRLPEILKLFDDYALKNNLNKIELADFGGGIGDITGFIKNNSKSGALIKATCFDINNDLLNLNNSADTKINTDLLNLSETQKFDIGIIRFVLNYNSKEEQLEILKNINNSLKKDGTLINWWCGISSHEHQNKFQKLFGTKNINTKLFRPNCCWTTWEENEELFKNASFQIKVIEKFKIPVKDLYKIRYGLTQEENDKILKFLGEYNFISYAIFEATKQCTK